jgi:hypothetical protein
MNRQEEYERDAIAFADTIDQEKMIQIPTDGGANPNPGAASCGVLIR